MFVSAVPNGDNGLWTLRCESCGKAIVPDVDLAVIAWIANQGDQVFCMDCDSISADELPGMFAEMGEKWDLGIRDSLDEDFRYIRVDVWGNLKRLEDTKRMLSGMLDNGPWNMKGDK